jgi:hypothetical protein
VITFIGRPKGEGIYVDVLLGNDRVSDAAPLRLTLDQWHELRKLSAQDVEREEGEPILWVTTDAEYQTTIGDPIPA